MVIHNTSYDAANTAVRVFLTKVGIHIGGKHLIQAWARTRKYGIR